MSEGSEQQRRFCTNCGAEVRAGTDFCVSCGANLVQERPTPGYDSTESRSAGSADSFSDIFQGKFRELRLRERLQGLRGWLLRSRSTLNSQDVRGMPGRALTWLRNLPPIVKIVLAALVLLILFVLLSPVMRIVAIVAFLVSVAVLILHGVQRRFVPRWGVAAVSSLALVFVFGGISGALYGNDSSEGEASGSGGGNEAAQPPVVSEQPDIDPSLASSGDWETTGDYINDMIDSEDKVDLITDDVREVLELTQDGYMSDSEAVAELAISRESLDTHRDYFRGTAPPEGFEQYHRLTLAGWDLYSEGLADMEEGARYYDMETIIDGFHTVEEGVDTIEEANQYIPEDIVREESL